MSAVSHSQETWLSVQDASAMLGVSPATLRRWSAAGEVEAFTTPGGHRRFSLSTLRSLLPASDEPGIPVSGAPEPDPEAFAEIGHRLAAALVRYLEAVDPAEASATLATVEELATEHIRLALEAALAQAHGTDSD